MVVEGVADFDFLELRVRERGETGTGEGKGGVTEIKFPTAKTQFIRITQTGKTPGTFWSIHEQDVFSDSKGQITAGKATAKLPSLE